MDSVKRKDLVFVEMNTDFDVESPRSGIEDDLGVSDSRQPGVIYFLAGLLFGIMLVKSEVMSWFRIQEMFRLQSFHMYGVLGSAVIVGAISVWLIKKFDVTTINGERIKFRRKVFSKGQVYGGLLFGLGWALTGACPGPLFAQIGTGATVVIVTLMSAIAGTWTYGLVRQKLPH